VGGGAQQNAPGKGMTRKKYHDDFLRIFTSLQNNCGTTDNDQIQQLNHFFKNFG